MFLLLGLTMISIMNKNQEGFKEGKDDVSAEDDEDEGDDEENEEDEDDEDEDE